MTGSYEFERLNDLLEIHVHMYETDFERHWGIGAESCPDALSERDWLLANQLDRIGRDLLAVVYTAALSPAIREALSSIEPDSDPLTALRSVSAYNVLRDRMQVVLGAEACRLMAVAEERIYDTVYLVGEHPPSARASAFLDRAMRSYIWGFDTECVVMCRAVLDAALQSTLEDESLESLGYKRRRGTFTLDQRISGAKRLGRVSPVVAGWAHEIRRHGNDAVHVAPGLAPKAFIPLAKLRNVLNQLFPEAEPPAA